MAHRRHAGTLAAILAAILLPAGARAADVTASAPTARAVTVYRAPDKGSGMLELDNLRGFALITETRTVSLPAGESRLRFAGVADGIESVSAILTGLPDGVLEKNRDAQVLSPGALVAATLGEEVILERTLRKTGKVTRVTGTLRADNDGVVFQSSDGGIEALRCSGLPETFSFAGAADLSPTPTLSVRVRTTRPLTATVTLSYLAHGFDWAATYSATLAPDEHTLSLGAWVTLANSNGVSFPQARVAVVAGKLNRVTGQVEPLASGERILASCWPMGKTSDIPEEQEPRMMLKAHFAGAAPRPAPMGAVRMMAMAPAPPPPPHVEEEQLGDLKLYRVPEATAVNARQLKQVRLLDKDGVQVELLHIAQLTAGYEMQLPASRVLRSRNDREHHLGVPLPSGRVATFTPEGDTPLLLAEAPVRDIAVNEDVEFHAGDAPDVQVISTLERNIAPATVQQIPLLPGVLAIRTGVQTQLGRIKITNARRKEITFEARLYLPADVHLVRSSVRPLLRDGRQVMRIKIRAGGETTIRYVTERRVNQPVRPR